MTAEVVVPLTEEEWKTRMTFGGVMMDLVWNILVSQNSQWSISS